MKENKKPNFLLIGAPKAGTTSIAAYLGEHPEIFMPEEKEPFYFIADIVKNLPQDDPILDVIIKKARLTWDDYIKLFESSTNEKYRGEATVHYLYHYDTVIPKIKEKLGDIPIILILRDPVTRAFSNHSYQTPVDLTSFEEALELEEKRKRKGWNSFWYYRENGLYFEAVSAYLDNFTKVYIGTFEEFKSNNNSFMRNLYYFLEVDSTFYPNLQKKHNPTLIPKNKLIQLIYYAFRKYNFGINLIPQSWKKEIRKQLFKNNNQKLNQQTAQTLYSFYKEDISKLSNLLDIDLSSWKDKATK